MLDDIYPKVTAGLPKPSIISEPRIFSLPKDTERYVIEGCGAILVPIEDGDQISIINEEGGQPCEVIAACPKGIIDPSIRRNARWTSAGIENAINIIKPIFARVAHGFRCPRH